ncbi:MAG TPA: serine/threonine protein kinase [Gammaproteobacteria bacterium]|nr:serine/threonine protein kinase [Gammaproteobacteria bacterium]
MNLPETLGKYQVKALLGQGAMGVVYQCFDPDIERTVAIKVVHPHLQRGSSGEESVERFRQEARAAARCQHPNIVTVYELGQQQGNDFIVMEYVQGEELRYFLETGQRFSIGECLHIAGEVLAALAHAHQQGVVHRDIKPANIILLDNGGVKVADFGVARLDQSELTLAGNMVGTPTYMAPEGLRGERVDFRGDLYSVGMVLLEMLTGCKPQPQELFSRPVAGFVAAALDGERGRALPASLRDAVATALADDAGQRFESAQAFRERLADTARSLDEERSALETLSETVVARQPVALEHASIDGPRTEWPAAMLETLEQTLAGYVGPLARILVNHSATRAGSVEELGRVLAEKIPDPGEREEFMTRFRHCALAHQCSGEHSLPSGGAPRRAPTATCMADRLGADRLEQLATLLAYYVGPLARNLVQHKARSASEPEQFIAELGDCIPSEQERAEFLARAPSLAD